MNHYLVKEVMTVKLRGADVLRRTPFGLKKRSIDIRPRTSDIGLKLQKKSVV